jgi:hypothetical protein
MAVPLVLNGEVTSLIHDFSIVGNGHHMTFVPRDSVFGFSNRTLTTCDSISLSYYSFHFREATEEMFGVVDSSTMIYHDAISTTTTDCEDLNRDDCREVCIGYIELDEVDGVVMEVYVFYCFTLCVIENPITQDEGLWNTISPGGGGDGFINTNPEIGGPGGSGSSGSGGESGLPGEEEEKITLEDKLKDIFLDEGVDSTCLHELGAILFLIDDLVEANDDFWDWCDTSMTSEEIIATAIIDFCEKKAEDSVMNTNSGFLTNLFSNSCEQQYPFTVCLQDSNWHTIGSSQYVAFDDLSIGFFNTETSENIVILYDKLCVQVPNWAPRKTRQTKEAFRIAIAETTLWLNQQVNTPTAAEIKFIFKKKLKRTIHDLLMVSGGVATISESCPGVPETQGSIECIL